MYETELAERREELIDDVADDMMDMAEIYIREQIEEIVDNLPDSDLDFAETAALVFRSVDVTVRAITPVDDETGADDDDDDDDDEETGAADDVADECDMMIDYIDDNFVGDVDDMIAIRRCFTWIDSDHYKPSMGKIVKVVGGRSLVYKSN